MATRTYWRITDTYRTSLRNERFKPSWHFPLGDTDSEAAFCILMDRLRAALSLEVATSLERKLPVIRAWAHELSEYGTFNVLLSDSEYLYAHRSTNLFYVSRSISATMSFGSCSPAGPMPHSESRWSRLNL